MTVSEKCSKSALVGAISAIIVLFALRAIDGFGIEVFSFEFFAFFIPISIIMSLIEGRILRAIASR